MHKWPKHHQHASPNLPTEMKMYTNLVSILCLLFTRQRPRWLQACIRPSSWSKWHTFIFPRITSPMYNFHISYNTNLPNQLKGLKGKISLSVGYMKGKLPEERTDHYILWTWFGCKEILARQKDNSKCSLNSYSLKITPNLSQEMMPIQEETLEEITVLQFKEIQYKLGNKWKHSLPAQLVKQFYHPTPLAISLSFFASEKNVP